MDAHGDPSWGREPGDGGGGRPGALTGRALWWAAATLVVAGALAAVVVGADRPADPVLVDAGRTPTGFASVTITVTAADGSTREACVWEASTPGQRQRGLMGVTDLGGRAGMLFVRSAGEATTSGFWMKDTPMPLSAAFFDADGRFINAVDMPVCTTGSCPVHDAEAPWTYGLEVPAGTLGRLGVGPGALLAVDGPCGDPPTPGDP